LLLGLLLAPLLIELALQLAALFVSGDRAGDDAQALVLCQGDSNTFGLNLTAEQAYPKQLEALLRERGHPGARVINRGVPGKPTWVVDQELQSDIERFAPRAIVVMCGLNNATQVRPEDEVDGALGRSRLLAFLRRTSKAVEQERVEPAASPAHKRLATDAIADLGPSERLVRLLDREAESRSFVMRLGIPTDETAQRWVVEDLMSAAARARAAGAVTLFCTYFDDIAWMGRANLAMESAARASGVRLVDTRPVFREALARTGRSDLVFPDGHLRADGYAVLARILYNALIEEGVVAGEPVDPLEMLGRVADDSIHVIPWLQDDKLLGVRVRFAPRVRIQLVLSGGEGRTPLHWDGSLAPGTGKQPFEVPLAHDELMARSLERVMRYTHVLDDSGEARILLDKEDAGAPSLFACAVAVSPQEKVEVVSPASRLR
jgi:lysophospholipase L1-like esterase